jgi:hypothetical protein
MVDSPKRKTETLGLSLLKMRLGRDRALPQMLFDNERSVRDICLAYKEAVGFCYGPPNDHIRAATSQEYEGICRDLEAQICDMLHPGG